MWRTGTRATSGDDASSLFAAAGQGGDDDGRAHHDAPENPAARSWGWSPDGSSWRAAAAILATSEDLASAPGTPWACVRTDGHTVRAAVSSTAQGGLYWTLDQARGDDSSDRRGQPAHAAPRLIFGTHLSALVRARRTRTTLDGDFIRWFALSTAPAERTPFAEVGRVAPGTTAVWQPGQREPRVQEWCGPATWSAEPTLRGPSVLSEYLSTFDDAIDELLDGANSPIAAAVSGGLDSTFMAASLARHCSTSAPLLALCHSPDPAAELPASSGHFAPDDYRIARELAQAYPGRIEVVRVVSNERGALDAAADFSARTWLPVFAPANQVWLDDIAERAVAAGADRLFHGANGNPAFSYSHPYALRHYAARRDWRSVARLAAPSRDEGAEPWPRQVRSRVAGPLVAPVRGARQERVRRAYLTHFGFPVGDEAGQVGAPVGGTMDRAGYLRWLRQDFSTPAAMGPAGWPLTMVDPFTSRGVLDLAARISPLEWSTRGPGNRGLARLLAAGRVPDAIRLRRATGGQGWDAWYHARNSRQRYLDEVEALADRPVLGQWLDARALRNVVLGWPWGSAGTGSLGELLAVDRILSLAAYCRAMQTNLDGLATS